MVENGVISYKITNQPKLRILQIDAPSIICKFVVFVLSRDL